MATLPTIHSKQTINSGKLLKIEQLELEFSNGVKRSYNRLCTQGLGSVIVIPMSDDDTVLLVHEYAAGLHHYELGLVKGRLEPGETILEGAQRELMEEIGFGANDLIELTALSLAPGYMTHVTHVVLARGLYPQKLQGDEPEPLQIRAWPIADLQTLVQRPDCTEGRSIAALYIARDYLQQETDHA